MARETLRLADGSSIGGIGSLSLTASVNSREDLFPGAACAAMLEVTVYGTTAPVQQGTQVDCYRGDTLLGRFICEQPRRSSANSFRFTGYDAMIRFDRQIASWLDGLTYPIPMGELLLGLCDHCGVTPQLPLDLPGQELTLEAFPTASVTGRQLLGWIGQAAGRYFTISPEGLLRAGWYTTTPVTLGGGGRQLRLADGLLADRYGRPFGVRGGLPYRLDSLSYSDYTTTPVERVLIRSDERDVGAVWPDGSDQSANTLILQGNPLLTPRQGLDLQAVARRLYEQLTPMAYTPFSCTLLPGDRLQPGDWVSFTDGQGNLRRAPVMEIQLQNGQCRISATGNPSLQSTAAFNHLTVGQVLGRVLTVERTAEGLQVAQADMGGELASLKLSLDGITTQVSQLETEAGSHATTTQLSELEQRADALLLTITQLRQDTDAKADGQQVEQLRQCFLFDETGLTISNSATGMGIGVSQERIVFTGGSDPTTAITPNEMRTTNLRVGSRLDVGVFSLIPRTSGNLSLRYTGG